MQLKHEREYFREAAAGMMPDFEQARRNARNTAGLTELDRKRRRRWAMPVLSAVCAVGLICALVPPVRASIVKFFSGGGTAAYLNAPAHERPEVENVAVQPVEQKNWQIRLFADTVCPWAEQITSVELEEALYDSGIEELTLRYTVDGSAFGLRGHEIMLGPDDEPLNRDGEAFPAVLPAQIIEDNSLLPAIEGVPEGEYEMPSGVSHIDRDTITKVSDGVVTMTSVFDLPRQAASGELTALVPCVTAVPFDDGMGLQYEYLGYLQIPFRIEPGYSDSRNAPAGVYMVNGQRVEIDEAVLSPTALEIRFILFSDVFPEDLDFNVYADGELLTAGSGADRISYLEYWMSDEEGRTEGMIRVPFPDNDIAAVALELCELRTGKPVTEDKILLEFE